MHSFSRRTFLRALPLLLCAKSAFTAEIDPAAARIRAFYDVLLETMKQATALGVKGRYKRLEPAVRTTYDLPAMTRIAVGPPWKTFTPDEQSALIEQFSRMSIATYASRFDGYDGERFEVEPQVETRNANHIVRSRIVRKQGDPVALNYLCHETPDGWKVIDVYLSGTVSELATRRAEFASVLKSGGAQGLIDMLRSRADKMIAG
jgi:phospholipid transport system substrate-binding protein